MAEVTTTAERAAGNPISMRDQRETALSDWRAAASAAEQDVAAKGIDNLDDETERLVGLESDAEGCFMTAPAPDCPALLLKLEQLLAPDSQNLMQPDLVQSAIVDARRLLGSAGTATGVAGPQSSGAKFLTTTAGNWEDLRYELDRIVSLGQLLSTLEDVEDDVRNAFQAMADLAQAARRKAKGFGDDCRKKAKQVRSAAPADDRAIEEAWARWQAARARYEALPSAEDSNDKTPEEAAQWAIMDEAEEVIRSTIAHSPNGAAIKLWIGLSHFFSQKEHHEAIMRRDLDPLIAAERHLDWNAKLVLSALRSLEAMAWGSQP